jgi:hypothetical protein
VTLCPRTRGRYYAHAALTLALAPAAACFSGDFLDNTCERMPGGCRSLETDSTTGTTGTTAADESSGTTVAPCPEAPPQAPSPLPPASGTLMPGPAFRLREAQLVDPHLYHPALNCDESGAFLTAELNASLADYETNLVFLTLQYDPDAATQSFAFFRDAPCDKAGQYCLRDPANISLPFVATNVDAGDCAVDVAPLSYDDEDILDLNRPIAPCFESPIASLQLQLIPEKPPVSMYIAQFAATYEGDDCDPQGLTRGVMTGFITREDAIAAKYTIAGFDIALWDVIRGSETNECEIPDGERTSVDKALLDGEYQIGVYLYLNVVFERIPMYDLGD